MTLGTFFLKIQRIEQICLFELSWERGQQLSVAVPYPETLDTLYKEWKSAYLNFYKSALRGRVGRDASIPPPPVDWHAKLVQAEAKLLYEFHNWLRQGELFELRSCLAKAVRDLEIGKVGEGEKGRTLPYVEVFLTCNPLDLARLPWEAWEIGTEFAATGKIRFVRTPPTIQEATATSRSRRNKARILAIWGDDTGLNFQADKEAVRSLSSIAEICFVGWQPGKNIVELKAEIIKVIADEKGWDILFFAGHSYEKELVGGEMAIAPGGSLFLNEIEKPLLLAKERGLQFVLFNSCYGLHLANALMNLGLSQVAVMREPIHNQVAQAFIMRFLQSLAQYKDVHESLLAACQYLQLEKHLTYPSAYLIPSLYRHPDAPLFRLKPFGIKQKLNRRLPTKTEAFALGTIMLLSLMAPVQHLLLNSRTLVQAIYRDATKQLPQNASQPVRLIAIDQESLNRADAEIEGFQTKPIEREYLATLVTRLSALNVRTIGINYLLNTQEPRQEKLAQSIEAAVNQQGTWFVFAASEPYNLKVTSKIASPNWSLQGDTTFSLWNVKLPATSTCTGKSCSFAYLLALSHTLHQQSSLTGVPQPKLQSPTDFQQQVSNYLKPEKGQNHAISSLGRTAPFGLRSIIDWSIPPNQIYERIFAWKFLILDLPNPELQQKLKEQVVIVTAGGYVDAEDNFPVPWAIDYWRYSHNSKEQRKEDYPKVFTGGEAQAYMVYQLLSQHQVVLIPALWMILLAAFLAKGTTLILLKQKSRQQQQWTAVLVGATSVYGISSLQIYISALVAIPWFLPSATFWIYVLLAIRKKS